MKQKDTLKYIVASLKKEGGRAPTKVLETMWPGDSYNYRWGQQILRQQGIIGIDKSVWPNEWYLK